MNVRNWHKKNQGKRKSQFSWGDISWWQLNVEERRLDRWFGSKVEGFSMLMDWWLWGQTQLSGNQEAGCKDSCCEYCDSWPAWKSGYADLCQLRRDELRGLSNSTTSLERWLSSHVYTVQGPGQGLTLYAYISIKIHSNKNHSGESP